MQKLENLPSRDPWTGELHLANVDADTGHVLIHYLHTAIYHTLNDSASKNAQSFNSNAVCDEFRKAVLVLEAATKHGVPGLQKLARTEMERLGAVMDLSDTVCAIRESFFAGPAHEHDWLRDFVSQKVRLTFQQNPNSFLTSEFFESIESPKLTKLVAQIVIGLYSREVFKLREERRANGNAVASDRSKPPPDSRSPDAWQSPYENNLAGSASWPASAEKFGAFDDSVAAWDPHNLDLN